MSSRRLIAYVEHSVKSLQWLWQVEFAGLASQHEFPRGPLRGGGGGSRPTAIEAMEAAEGYALEQGYGLDWRGGFVAHGVPVETSERGAQEA